MEKASDIKDVRSFEASFPSELDRKFWGEQSLLSALSTSRTSNDTTADGSDARPSVLASLCLSADPISPSPSPSVNSLNAPETDGCLLAGPLQGKSSTPYMFLKKQRPAACVDQSYSDLTVSQMSWDVSLIKSENSPKPCMDSSGLEATGSPRPPSTQRPSAGVSP